MNHSTEYTFTRPDGTQAHHIVDPDCGTSVIEQIGMFSRMEGATSAAPTNDRDGQVGTAKVGAEFIVAEPSGIYGKGQRWTVTAIDQRGRLNARRSVDQFSVVWNEATLAMLIASGILEPAAPVDVPRDRQILDLRAASPMRGPAGQHDASDLDLFRTFNEPRLI